MSLDSIRQFFRENPRAWLVGVAAVLTLVIAVWGIWGDFSLQFGSLFAEVYCNPSDHSQPAVARLTIKIFFVEGSDTPPNPIPLDAVVHFDATGKSSAGECLTDGSSNVVWSITPSDGGEIRPRGGNPFTPILRTIKNGTYQIRATLDGINSNTLTITVGSGGGGPCPVPPTTSSPATLTVTCGPTQNVLRWQNPLTLNASVNSVLRNVNGGTGQFIFTEGGCWNTFGISTYTDTNVQPGQSYAYRVKTSASAVSNEVTCGGGATPTSPPPTVTPPPVYPPLQCSPLSQTVARNQSVRLEASGGDGRYQWNITGGGILEEGGSQYIVVSYPVAGLKTLRVNSVNQSAPCTVNVVGDVPTASTSTTPTASLLDVQKSGRNITIGDATRHNAINVSPHEVAEFTVTITNNGGTTVNGLRVLDTVPGGMSYIAGSTIIDGQPFLVDTITTSGLTLSSLTPGTIVTIRWSAVADSTEQLVAGPQQFQSGVRVTAIGVSDAMTDMSVTVYGSGFAGGGGNGNTGGGGSGGANGSGSGNPGGVATGPGEAVTIALVMAAALTLLYSGYTRSAAYRHHEADAVSRDQGPMDFRS